MPIAIMEQHGDPTSPLSPRMTKAAFFRARSPPVLDRTSATGTARAHSPNELAARFHQADLHSPVPLPLHAPSQAGSSRSPELLGPGGSATFVSPAQRNGFDRGYASSVGTQGHTPPMQHSAGVPNAAGPSGGPRAASAMAQGSDEMLMTLLAGQAAVDCETFGVATWEDVEGWKKVCLPKRELI